MLMGAGLFLSLNLLHAQETASPFQLDSATVAGMSDLEVELKAVESVPPMPAESLPEAGTFWSAQHAPGTAEEWPPLPTSFGMGAWSLGDDGVYLLADLNHVYGHPKKSRNAASLTATTSVGVVQTISVMSAMDLNPGDGGDDTNSDSGNVSPAYSPAIAPGTNLWLAITGISNQTANFVVSNTVADVQYEIQATTNLAQSNWSSLGFFYGSETTNWTPASAAATNYPNLFYRIRSWQSSDGSGIPDWWEIFYFGTNGIDPYGDPAGDGWSNLQKFQNGWNPNVFYTPPPPPGFSVSYNSISGTVTLNWQPSQGNVTGYTITRYNPNTGGNDTFNFLSGVTSFVDTSPITNFPPENYEPTYTLQADYALGYSSGETLSMFDPNTTVSAQLVEGSNGGRNLVATGPIPSGTTALRLTFSYLDESTYGDYITGTTNIPISDLSGNSVFLSNALFNNQDDSYDASEDVYVQTVNADGEVSSTTLAGSQSWFDGNQNPTPFLDGRQQLEQNADFILRAAIAGYPLQFLNNVDDVYYVYPSNYSFSGLYQVTQEQDGGSGPILDRFLPFEENYLFHNFVYTASDINPSNGTLTTGLGLTANGTPAITAPTYVFTQYQATSNIPAILDDSSSAQWVTFYPQQIIDYVVGNTLGFLGLTGGSGNIAFTNFSGTTNIYGLPYNSVKFAYNNGGGIQTATLPRGGTISGVTNGGVFWNAATPQLQTVGYYFAQPGFEPLPGDAVFSTATNTSSGLVAGFGSSTVFAGYARRALLNGYTNVFSYLGQYFDSAWQIDANGNVTTNSAGAISPYGEFTATAVGPVALVTMTNWGENVRGTGVVQVVKLVLDVNHDGVMDMSVSGPDNTSASSPFTFWANNNYDRWTWDADDATYYEDDLSPAEVSQLSADQQTPDCNYGEYYGTRIIPDTRDLQDFTRLWVAGITTNLLTALPPGSTITLNWGDVGNPDWNANNPTIDLFTAADADGGIGYLTNSVTASNQIDYVSSPFVGRLAPGGSIQLNASTFANHWAGNHFIWCGVSNGSGGLNLTIADGHGNTIAQTTTYIQIEDIKNMYERWTVGDEPGRVPTSTAIIAKNDLPDPTQLPFQYTQPQDTNTPYILLVHGWNLETWNKDRWAEAAFKRLYWQGYQGRFGEFRWPTGNGFIGTWAQLLANPGQKDNFDASEYQAWQSAQGLLNKLMDLNAEYPGHVYMLAHSMGNVVAGEALRLAGTNQIVNTYVASQAAISAHTYDTTIANYSFYYPPWSLAADSPNIYGNWFADNNGGGAGQIISFYNTNDYALQRSAWQRDELLKPDQLVLEGSSVWDYKYNGSPNDPAPWNNFYKQNDVTYATVNFDIVGNLANRYEVMGYAAQSYTTALGATPNVGNLTRSLNLIAVWPSPDPLGKNYTSHFYHSAEFRGNTVLEWGYWNTLLFSSQFGFNIVNP